MYILEALVVLTCDVITFGLLIIHKIMYVITHIQTHLQADKGDRTGFDVILEKHLNGKEAIKDITEFMKERLGDCSLTTAHKLNSRKL